MIDLGRTYLPNTALVSHSQRVYAIVGEDDTLPVPVLNREWLFIMEALVYGGSLDQAYQRFSGDVREGEPNGSPSEPVVVHLTLNRILVNHSSGEVEDVVGQPFGVVAAQFAGHDFAEPQAPISSLENFAITVQHMAACGLVAPVRGTLDWGDFRRIAPFCPTFGTSRGTPIDRLYLSQFIDRIRDQVTGQTLEIGGIVDNQEMYGLPGCTDYHSLEMQAGPGITHVGDAHDSGLFEPATYDSILMFNVLEHCHSPQTIVDNVQRWLKPGGACFLMVPNAQRVHNYPADYWRPMPEGIGHLLRNFDETKLFVYGNPTTFIASVMGVAAEELTPQEVSVCNPEYPVATCAVASRSSA